MTGTHVERPVALLLLMCIAACRPSPTPTETPAPVPTPASTPVVEHEPLTCSEDRLAIIGDEAIPMSRHAAIMDLKHQKYIDRGRDIPKTAERRYRLAIAERVIYLRLLELEIAKLGLADYDPEVLAAREAEQRERIEDWPAHLRRRGESDASLRDLYIAEQRERRLIEQRGVLEASPEEVEAEFQKFVGGSDASVDRVRAWSVLLELEPDRPSRATMAKLRLEAERVAAAINEPDAGLSMIAWIEARRMSDPIVSYEGYEGDTGIVTYADMPPEWSKRVFKAKVGETLLIETTAGIHVVKITGHWGPGPLPLAAFEQELRARVEARKLSDARRSLRDELFERYQPVDCEAERVGPDPRRSRSEDDAGE